MVFRVNEDRKSGDQICCSVDFTNTFHSIKHSFFQLITCSTLQDRVYVLSALVLELQTTSRKLQDWFKYSSVKMTSIWKKVKQLSGLNESEDNQDDFNRFDEIEPELLVKFLRIPSLKNYSGLRTKLGNCDEVWMKSFLEHGGLSILFDAMERLGERQVLKFTDAFVQMECVQCIKAVLNHGETSLEFMIQSKDFTRQLVAGKTQNDSISFYRKLKKNYCLFHSTFSINT